jgi:hypothetical protein
MPGSPFFYIFVAMGLGFAALVAHALKTGVARDKGGSVSARADDPLMYWMDVGLYTFVAATCFGVAIMVVIDPP